MAHDNNLVNLQRVALRAGYALMALSFASGLIIPLYQNIKTGLAAHVLGITSSLFLLATALVLPQLKLNDWQRALMIWPMAVGFFVGFVTQVMGGLFGLSRAHLVTAAGLPPGHPVLELISEALTKYALTPVAFLPCFLALYGLRGPPAEVPAAAEALAVAPPQRPL